MFKINENQFINRFGKDEINDYKEDYKGNKRKSIIRAILETGRKPLEVWHVFESHNKIGSAMKSLGAIRGTDYSIMNPGGYRLGGNYVVIWNNKGKKLFLEIRMDRFDIQYDLQYPV